MQARLKELADKLIAAEDLVKEKEDELKAAKKELQTVAETLIPEALENLELEEFKTEEGHVVKVKEKVVASPPAARRAEAMKWLDDNGYGDIIKTSVTVAFDRGDVDQATRFLTEMTGQHENVKYDARVEPQTMAAWARERLESGDAIPLDLFGVHNLKKATIKRKK